VRLRAGCTDPSSFFFFTGLAAPELYTLSLHDALPISAGAGSCIAVVATDAPLLPGQCEALARRVTLGLARTGTTGSHFKGYPARDRKSTRLNSSHVSISYAVFCLKKKNHKQKRTTERH